MQGGEVRRTERKWKSLSKQERESFLAHAHENHEKNDFTKEHMREARKEIIKRNQELAGETRQRKVNDAMVAMEKKEELDLAKKAVRDSMYTARYADANKAKIMGQSMQEATALTGVAAALPTPMPTPYKIP